MAGIGWVAIHRSICENKLWFLEPFTKAQAWIDLLLNANHDKGIMQIRGNIVTIERGQLGWSELTMAKRWKWSRMKVRRFLKWLEGDSYVIQQKIYKLTSITTIVNYDKYQTIQQKDNRRYNRRDTNNNDNNDKQISKDMVTPVYGNKDLISLGKFLKNNYPKPLMEITDTRKLQNFKQIMSKRKNQDEWMDDNWKENVKKFLALYLDQTDDKYLVNSVSKLKEKAKLWREYRGKLN